MDNIVIVSAFFSIGRDNFKKIPRTNNQYVEYFKRWARIQNELIFFCEDKEFGDVVLDIRDSFGLKEKTKIIVFDNILKLENDLYKKMELIENDKYYQDFRVDKDFPENKAIYNYVMFMKHFCVHEALKYLDKEANLVWIDFGYEHGGKAFKSEESYNFEWKYDFNDKVNIFHLKDIDKRPMFEICRTVHPDNMMGSPFVVPSTLAEEFYDLVLKSYYMLAYFGLMDDDQLYLLWAYRQRPDIIVANESDWFLPIAQYSNGSFEIKEKKISKLTLLQRIKLFIKRVLGIRR